MIAARALLAGGIVLSAGVAILAQSPPAPAILRLSSTTRVRETDSVFIARPSGIALGAAGQFYVSERGEARVLENAPNGVITRLLGRKGNGPGELRSPGALALSGDTLLVVMDNGLRRASLFNLRNGKFVSSFPVPAFLPALRVERGELLVSAIDVPSATAVAVYDFHGTLKRRDGGLPATARKFMKLSEAMPFARVAVVGVRTYAAFDMSQSLLAWTRDAGSLVEIPLPVATRRGVSEAVFEDLMRNPQRARELLYAHSAPAALEALPSGRLALLTYDAEMVGENGTFDGTFHMTIVDVAGRRVCPEVPVPARRTPLPSMTLRGNTLVVLEQGDNGNAEAVTTLRRFTIDDRACAWKRL